MITVLCGVAGKGKTALATRLAIKEALKNRPVFSNYPISFKIFGLPITSQIATSEMLKNRTYPENAYVILDEAQNIYNSRYFKDMTKDEIEYLSGHRHMGIDIVITTQHPNRIDIVLRENAEKFIWIRHALPFGFKVCYEYVLSEHVGFMPPQVPKEYIKLKLYRVSRSIYTMYNDKYLKDRFKPSEGSFFGSHDYKRTKYIPYPLRLYWSICQTVSFYHDVWLARKEYRKAAPPRPSLFNRGKKRFAMLDKRKTAYDVNHCESKE